LGMDILRLRSGSVALTGTGQLALKELQARFDMDIGRVEVSSPTVRIKRVRNLVVARLVLLIY
jgi:hypothetical protein